MHKLDVAILKTIVYGNIFHFPMTLSEIHHFLICDEPMAIADVQDRLETSETLESAITTDGRYYALNDRHELFELRYTRENMMNQLSKQMCFYGRILCYFPFVELVGVTGALSMRNPSTPNDDLDYLIVTRPGRVWLARAMIIVLVRLMRLRKIELCPNYVLASDQLMQSRQDLYIAHEISQLLPLTNMALYEQLRALNPWTTEIMPNANQPFYNLIDKELNVFGLYAKRGLEALLSTRLGTWFERWEYQRKSRRFQEQAQLPKASAEIDEGHVKGHFEDYGHYVLNRYYQQLDALGQVEVNLPSAGD